jgi:hypothetical protein
MTDILFIQLISSLFVASVLLYGDISRCFKLVPTAFFGYQQSLLKTLFY